MLASCNACAVPEIANFWNRCRIPFRRVTGTLDGDDEADRKIHEWVYAARVASVMEHNRLGVMGHDYNGMLDLYRDLTRQIATFGGHVEIVEVDEWAALRRT